MTKSRRAKRPKLQRVRFDEYTGEIRVGEHGAFGWDPLGDPFGSLDEVGEASLTQLRDALRRMGRGTFAVSRDSAEQFDPEYASADDTTFEFESGRLLTKVEGWLDGYSDDEPDGLERLISRFLQARSATVKFFEAYDYSANTYVTLTYETPYYGRSVRDIVTLAGDARALLQAAVTGRVTSSSAIDLILGGRVEALVGLHETSWLEAKRAPYDLRDEAQGLELALDVAALANGDAGGLLVVGLATKKDADGDLIVRVTPANIPLIDRGKHRRLLDRLIFPPITGLQLHVVSHGSPDLGLLVIEVPPQPEQLKPFLVGGALLSGKHRGSYFSVVTRRDDSRLAASVAEIHGLLAAGRLATRLEER